MTGQQTPVALVPFLGTRLAVSDEEKVVLLGACVDMAIDLRPYTPEMN